MIAPPTFFFYPSHLLTFPPLHFVVCRIGSRHGNVFCLLPSQLSSGFWQYPLSPASISLSIYCHLQYLSRGLIFIWHLHMSKPSQLLHSEKSIGEIKSRRHHCSSVCSTSVSCRRGSSSTSFRMCRGAFDACACTTNSSSTN